MAVVAAHAAVFLGDGQAGQARLSRLVPHGPLDDAFLAPFGDAGFRRMVGEEPGHGVFEDDDVLFGQGGGAFDLQGGGHGDQKASAGSCIRVAEPVFSLARWAVPSGMIRSTK